MRKPKTLMVAVALLVGPTLAAVGEEPKPEGDLAALQGEWTSKNDQGTSYWTFKGNRLSIKAPDRAYEMTFTLDPKMKPNKHVDFEILADSPNSAGDKAPGIYEIVNKDFVRVAIAATNAERPLDFEGGSGRAFTFDLRRKKE